MTGFMRNLTGLTLLETTSKNSISYRNRNNLTIYLIKNSTLRYNQWSPPAQSNETSNGYFLERSHSARITLDKSIELCPEEEAESEDQAGGVIGNGPGDNSLVSDAGGEETEPLSTISDDPSASTAVKPISTNRMVHSGIVQPRPGHAQAASPRASVPIHPNTSMPRYS